MVSQSVGSRISQARAEQGVSVRQLATRIGVKPATVENWECDRSEPRANKLLMLAGILNVPILRLLGDGGPNGEVIVRREADSEVLQIHQKLERAKTLHNELYALLCETASAVADLRARDKPEDHRAA